MLWLRKNRPFVPVRRGTKQECNEVQDECSLFVDSIPRPGLASMKSPEIHACQEMVEKVGKQVGKWADRMGRYCSCVCLLKSLIQFVRCLNHHFLTLSDPSRSHGLRKEHQPVHLAGVLSFIMEGMSEPVAFYQEIFPRSRG